MINDLSPIQESHAQEMTGINFVAASSPPSTRFNSRARACRMGRGGGSFVVD